MKGWPIGLAPVVSGVGRTHRLTISAVFRPGCVGNSSPHAADPWWRSGHTHARERVLGLAHKLFDNEGSHVLAVYRQYLSPGGHLGSAAGSSTARATVRARHVVGQGLSMLAWGCRPGGMSPHTSIPARRVSPMFRASSAERRGAARGLLRRPLAAQPASLRLPQRFVGNVNVNSL